VSETRPEIKPIRRKTFEKAVMGHKLTKAEEIEIAEATASLQAYADYLNRRSQLKQG